MSHHIDDLRSAIEFLKTKPGQYIETDEAISPVAEISGVYRYIGAGGTVQRPTQIGPMMVFNNIKGFPGSRVAIGVMSSRERVAMLLNAPERELGAFMSKAVNNMIAPVMVEKAPCQEVIYRASDAGFDLRTLLPAPTNTPEDAGPYITLGLLHATDPETGEEDVTIHRMCVQSKDELSIWLTPGRHIESFRQKAEKAGKPLPVTINIGLDPAIYIASCFEAPTTPLGLNELAIAGGLRGKPVEMVKSVSINEKSIAKAEIVIEGEFLPEVRVREDQNSDTGKAMPEFPGYTGPAAPALPVIKVKAVTTRKDPIMQTCIGPSEEHVNMAGIPTEASILNMCEKAMPGKVLNVYATTSGGGKLMVIMQFKKTVPADQGRERQAALTAFAAYNELKTIILVDDDVDIFDANDVMWAMNSRYQADVDTVIIPGVRCHPLDPSQEPYMSPSIRARGISCKTIFDCTVPFDLKDRFQRAQFLEVRDWQKYLPKK